MAGSGKPRRPEMAIGRHPGSKRGYTHRQRVTVITPTMLANGRLDPGQEHRSDQVRYRPPQKCLPPAVRQRQPVKPSSPMASDERLMHYQTARIRYSTGLLEGLTGPQRRRYYSKHFHALHKPHRS